MKNYLDAYDCFHAISFEFRVLSQSFQVAVPSAFLLRPISKKSSQLYFYIFTLNNVCSAPWGGYHLLLFEYRGGYHEHRRGVQYLGGTQITKYDIPHGTHIIQGDSGFLSCM